MPEKYTPEDISKFTESRAISDGKLIEGGAHFAPNPDGEPVLRVTKKEFKAIKNQDPSTREVRERRNKTEVLRTFSIPDQTDELDFKQFINQPLFNSWYRVNIQDEDEGGEVIFRDMVENTAKPFNGIKGGQFQEIVVSKPAGQKAVMSERHLEPISLNEWRYLFTQLTKEQLIGATYYLVRFDDGVVRSIESMVHSDPGIGNQFRLSIQKLSPEAAFDWSEAKPRFIAPAEAEEKTK